MRRSLATHTLGVKPPTLDTPDLVLQGAGHYETGCRPCHGSPGAPMPRVPQQMTPHPPNLLPVIAELQPDELFYVVKHGVKFTGMPAWPTQQRVPSCVDCHGPGSAPRNPVFPILAGQYADYLALQLQLFKAQHRGGSTYAHLMHPVSAWLTAADGRDVALYYASLKSGSEHLMP